MSCGTLAQGLGAASCAALLKPVHMRYRRQGCQDTKSCNQCAAGTPEARSSGRRLRALQAGEADSVCLRNAPQREYSMHLMHPILARACTAARSCIGRLLPCCVARTADVLCVSGFPSADCSQVQVRRAGAAPKHQSKSQRRGTGVENEDSTGAQVRSSMSQSLGSRSCARVSSDIL